MPVYWFALGQVVNRSWSRALLIFFILHVLIYPASNGYNSLMDRDTTPIGGLRSPLQPTGQLFWVTLGMDALGLLLGTLISWYFVAGLALYILASRAYSYREIRLKKYPVIGYITVISCQGALVFFLVYHGSHSPSALQESLQVPPEAMIACSLLLGGFYPLTQIYQHEADRKDGVKTLSAMLGYKGTFVFTGLVYIVAFLLLAHYFLLTLQIREFQVLATCMLPVIVYFLIWAAKVWRDPEEASYSNTMRMNLIASACTNAGFIAILLMGIL
ncbi:MAG: UbiA prenyltransferase family protein [Bacteroidetes bacterium]|nr:UbiA prenyltransferase family protein [Bacteroidota bacterium]